MPQQDSVHTPLVLGIASTGLVTGALAVAGVSPEIRVWVWIASFIAWVVAAVLVDSDRTYLGVALGSVLAGLCTGGMQTLMFETYHRNNSMALYDMPIDRLEFARVVFSRGLMLGLGAGVILGGIAAVIVTVRRRSRRAAAQDRLGA